MRRIGGVQNASKQAGVTGEDIPQPVYDSWPAVEGQDVLRNEKFRVGNAGEGGATNPGSHNGGHGALVEDECGAHTTTGRHETGPLRFHALLPEGTKVGKARIGVVGWQVALLLWGGSIGFMFCTLSFF